MISCDKKGLASDWLTAGKGTFTLDFTLKIFSQEFVQRET